MFAGLKEVFSFFFFEENVGRCACSSQGQTKTRLTSRRVFKYVIQLRELGARAKDANKEYTFLENACTQRNLPVYFEYPNNDKRQLYSILMKVFRTFVRNVSFCIVRNVLKF